MSRYRWPISLLCDYDYANCVNSMTPNADIGAAAADWRFVPRSVSSFALRFCNRSEWLVRRAAPRHPNLLANGCSGPNLSEGGAEQHYVSITDIMQNLSYVKLKRVMLPRWR